MRKNNMFWPVYKNLERDIQMLADRIQFTDTQVNVYSLYIADLLVRTAIEIESISKELYYENGGDESLFDDKGVKRDIFFDTDCLKLLNDKWKLDSKQVNVTSSNFYFTEDDNKILKPLYKADKRGTSGCRWKQAYQAVKHDRKNSLEKATIKNLLHAMAALYILNIYYKDETIRIGRDFNLNNEFDNTAGSKIFSVFCYEAIHIAISSNMDDDGILQMNDNSLDNSVYIIKHDDNYIKDKYVDYCFRMQQMFNDNEILKTPDMLPTELIGSMPKDVDTRYEVILNKNLRIYQPISLIYEGNVADEE